MAYSGIGGQAVMEGVMMRCDRDVAVAVRLTDGTIHVDKKKVKEKPDWVEKVPIVRGIYNFFHSLVVGMGALFDSSAYFDEDPNEKKDKVNDKKETLEIGGTLLISFALAIGIFVAIPFYLSGFLNKWITSPEILAFAEGVVRLIIFLLYVWIIGKTEDIRRVFMYHGAEHKCINCIEDGKDLTLENVRSSSRFHKRCGTSFIFIVFIISIFVFMFIRSDIRLVQLGMRILLMPLIAGISYEFIRLAGRSNNPIVGLLSLPGLWIQRLTTKEPDDDMIRVGIASVEAVFDWKKFLEKQGGTDEKK
ncbi:MAG: DUF1385 domain-containing protein [Lachnospiraceae bacterium]|nr:DUF1385 domain-containing protein [Lachnospiraceae bacterium]